MLGVQRSNSGGTLGDRVPENIVRIGGSRLNGKGLKD